MEALTRRVKTRDTKSRYMRRYQEKRPRIVHDTLRHDLKNTVTDTKEQLDAIESKLVTPTKVKLAKEEYLNLSNFLLDKMMTGTPAELDILCRALFLHVSLDNEKPFPLSGKSLLRQWL